MNTLEKVERGTRMFRAGNTQGLTEYLNTLRHEDPLASALLEVSVAVYRSAAPEALRKGIKLLPRVSDDPELGFFLAHKLGVAYRLMGEIEAAENHLARAVEIAERIGRKAYALRTILFYIRFVRGEYESLYRDIKSCIKDASSEERDPMGYLLSILEVILGMPRSAEMRIDALMETGEGSGLRQFMRLEIKGLAARLQGEIDRARELWLESARGFANMGSAYSIFPCAKVLEVSKIAGAEPPPPGLVRRCMRLARRGSVGEMAASEAAEALMREDPVKVSEGLLGAAISYHRAHQNLEAFTSGATAALLAWQHDGPVFTRACKFLADTISLYPGFKKDPLLGEFLAGLESFLKQFSYTDRHKRGIKAYLVGKLKVLVDGREISLDSWGNRKALMLLVYLLLSSKHRIAMDHLEYLLWPTANPGEPGVRKKLYVAASVLRKRLGRPSLLSQRHDFYQLEEVWTDLEEIESLLRMAGASRNPSEKEEYLDRARQAMGDDLLPEIVDDRYVDEYRQYYRKLKTRVSGEDPGRAV